MNFSKWTKGLRLKLLAVSLVPILGLALVAYIGATTANKLNAEIYKAYEIRAKLIEYSGDMESAVHATVRMAWTAVNMNDANERKAAVEKTRNYVTGFDRAKDGYIKIPRSKEMIELFEPVNEQWPLAKKNYEELFQLIDANGGDLRATGAAFIVEKIRPSMTVVTNQLNKMQTTRREMMTKEVEQIKADTQQASLILMIVSIVAGLTSLILGLTIAAKTAQAIMQVTEVLNSSSQQVSSAAGQIASSSQELSQSTTEQASSLEETAASLEEMGSMVLKNSESAKKSAEASSSSQSSATHGKEVMTDMITAMDGINDSNRQIAEIVKVISAIGDKTKVINDIVFQTKLLSFNASVEAARAGEHGKGFAVVAEEVGKLAQMSGNAAKEISALLDGSIQKVEGIVNDTKLKVESGTQIARQCSEVLDDIVQSVSSVNGMMGDISNASQEQAQGVQEITKAMSQLDQVTQQNAAASEQTASAAEELSAQAEALKSAVLQLVQLIEGEISGVSIPPSSNSAGPNPEDGPKNVVPFKKKARKTLANEPLMKAASGDGTVPHYEHSGFQDV